MKFAPLTFTAAALLAACAEEQRGPRWISIEDPFGAALTYVDEEHVSFSIGCSENKARVRVSSIQPRANMTDVQVRLGGFQSAFAQVDRAVVGIVAEAPLTEAWVGALDGAHEVSVAYDDQNFGPLALSQEWRAALADRCRNVIGASSRFP